MRSPVHNRKTFINLPKSSIAEDKTMYKYVQIIWQKKADVAITSHTIPENFNVAHPGTAMRRYTTQAPL